MKIASVETFLVTDRWFFIRISTDNGISGFGEGGFWGYPKAIESILETIKNYLLNKDPLQIEHHWQYVYRNNHFRGGALSAALSAVDIALWDIAGKYYDAPAYQLLGGKVRDKIRLYVHVAGKTPDSLAENAIKAAANGFTAVRFSPFPEGFENMSHAELIKKASERIRNVRDAVGDKVDICIDVHGRLTPFEAVILGKELEKYNLLFYEDPTVQDSPLAVASVAQKITAPVATGERLNNIFEFKDLLELRAVAMIRPDISLAGGLTQCKKIAALAEAYQVGVVPHNPLGPICMAASVQLAACIPNLVVLEYIKDDQDYMGEKKSRPPENKLISEPLKIDNGYVLIPETKGIGVDLKLEALEQYQYTMRNLETKCRDDGSVVDY